jgi:GxxExxY protein
MQARAGIGARPRDGDRLDGAAFLLTRNFLCASAPLRLIRPYNPRMTINEITEAIIGAAIEVHRALGPGLLESAYRQCLCHELQLRGLAFVCERPLPVIYKGLRLDCGYRVDLIVAEAVVVELKTVDRLAPVQQPLLTCAWVVGSWAF